MRKIQCHECGRTYDFDAEDFCPGCGAFTQPPHTKTPAGDAATPAPKKQRGEGRKEPLFRRIAAAGGKQKKRREAKGEGSGDLAFEILTEVLDVALDFIDP